jgi:hypothetical protein
MTKGVQAVADWLARSFGRAAEIGTALTIDDCMISVSWTSCQSRWNRVGSSIR